MMSFTSTVYSRGGKCLDGAGGRVCQGENQVLFGHAESKKPVLGGKSPCLSLHMDKVWLGKESKSKS